MPGRGGEGEAESEWEKRKGSPLFGNKLKVYPVRYHSSARNSFCAISKLTTYRFLAICRERWVADGGGVEGGGGRGWKKTHIYAPGRPRECVH